MRPWRGPLGGFRGQSLPPPCTRLGASQRVRASDRGSVDRPCGRCVCAPSAIVGALMPCLMHRHMHCTLPPCSVLNTACYCTSLQALPQRWRRRKRERKMHGTDRGQRQHAIVDSPRQVNVLALQQLWSSCDEVSASSLARCAGKPCHHCSALPLRRPLTYPPRAD